MSRRRALLAVVVAALLPSAGCGVPDDGTVATVAPDDVPYHLLEASPGTTSVGRARDAANGAGVYFTRGDRLVRVGLDLASTPADVALARALHALTTGPTADERRAGLGTAVPAGLHLRATRRPDGVAEVELAGEAAHPGIDQNVPATAQIVLTAASVPAVDAVVLVGNGQRIDPVLPGGDLATRPVTASDYAGVVLAPSDASPPGAP